MPRIVTYNEMGEIIEDRINPDPYDTIKVDVDKNLIVPDGVDFSTITLKLVNMGEINTSANGLIYYVPIFKIDGSQAALKKIEFTEGIAEFTFSATEESIYSIDMSKIRPKPTAILCENIEIIVNG